MPPIFEVCYPAGQLRCPAPDCARQPLAGENQENGLSRGVGVRVEKRGSCIAPNETLFIEILLKSILGRICRQELLRYFLPER